MSAKRVIAVDGARVTVRPAIVPGGIFGSGGWTDVGPDTECGHRVPYDGMTYYRSADERAWCPTCVHALEV